MWKLPVLILACSSPLLALEAPSQPPEQQEASATLLFQDDEEEEVPDKRPEVADAIGRMTKHVKAKEDAEAIGVMDELVQEFERSGPKDRGSIVKGLDKVFSAKRQEDSEGVLQNQIYIAAAVSLGEMGKDATKSLTKWIDHKSHRKDMALQRRLILSLGKTGDESCLDTLEDLLSHKSATMQSSASEAIAMYAEVEQKRRKELFESCLKCLTEAKAAMDADTNDNIARERYDAIGASLITTLQKLTGHDERKPEEWRRWWNKNKKEDWDA